MPLVIEIAGTESQHCLPEGWPTGHFSGIHTEDGSNPDRIRTLAAVLPGNRGPQQIEALTAERCEDSAQAATDAKSWSGPRGKMNY